MRKLTVLLIMALFATLTVLYFRYAIWAPPEALLTRHLATDLYGHCLHAWESLKLLGQGIIPLGDYWVQRGGGYPAALNDQLLLPYDFLLMVAYTITNSFPLALKAVVIPLHFAILPLAYWYGTIILKRRDASIILAVAYTFSLYGINQLEHPELFVVQPFILLTLIFLEKVLASPDKLRYMLLTSLGLLLVWLSQPYPFYFLLIFIAFRLVFQLATSQSRLEALKCTSKISIFSILAIVPFTLPLLLKTPPGHFVENYLNVGLSVYAQPPTLYFLRDTSFLPHQPEIYYMYVGISVLLLALIPMLLRRSTLTNPRLYLFHLLTATFFFLYAVGQYGPINLASWFGEHVPSAYFIRVPGRALVLGYLSLSICAAIGFSTLTARLKARWIPLIVLLVVSAIFADLTMGYEPRTTTVPVRPEGVHEFLRGQPDDFRVIEIPSVNGQQAMTTVYTERDVLNATIWAFGHFEPLWTFADTYHGYINRSITAQSASLYGVKYIATNTDLHYFSTFHEALRVEGGLGVEQVRKVDKWLSESDDYMLVYNEGQTNVYENLEFRGLVFSDETGYLDWFRRDPNTLVMAYDSTTPTSIIISQSYSKGWVATLDGKDIPVYEYKSIQQLDVPAGSHSVVLHYQNYERWFIVLAVCYAMLITVIVWLFIKRRRFEKC